MAILLRMPSLSPTMETGVITAWMKKVGDFIDVGEVLAEIETDKAVMEYEMPDEGYIRVLMVEPGLEIAVGTPIAILAESMDEDISAEEAEAKEGVGGSGNGGADSAAPTAPPGSAAESAPSAVQAASTQSTAQVATQNPTAAAPLPPLPQQPAGSVASGDGGVSGNGSASGNGGGGRIKISPYARKLARERNVSIEILRGSGPGGRIVAKDVEAAPAGGVGSTGAVPGGAVEPMGPALPPAPEIVIGGAPFVDEPLSMMRKAIARKMAESKASVPHFQLTRKIRAEALLEGRESLKAQFPDRRITVNDIIVKACATALRQHPAINSQFLEDRVRRFNTVDISVAVGTGDGLITPIVRNADLKGLTRISAEIKGLAEKAKAKKLAPEDYTGGAFTVSNLGMYGVTEFNAIINAPQACILAVSGVVTEPVVEGDTLAVGRTMNLTLSSDHRVVDGLAAAQFMDTLAVMLENPLAMLL